MTNRACLLIELLFLSLNLMNTYSGRVHSFKCGVDVSHFNKVYSQA